MKVSIIITNFNYEDYLEDCIKSCINQSYKNIEVIVVDDGSTDNSKDIIEKYSNSITKIYQKNEGMIGASNTGFKSAKGEIIMFIDADDYLYKNAKFTGKPTVIEFPNGSNHFTRLPNHSTLMSKPLHSSAQITQQCELFTL